MIFNIQNQYLFIESKNNEIYIPIFFTKIEFEKMK